MELLAAAAKRTARARQQREQRERDEALGLDGERLGGETAERWGRRKREKGVQPAFDEWEWLDQLDTDLLFGLDLLVSRCSLLDQRPEYLLMLHHGFHYADTFSTSEAVLRGFKYVVLAKAVTTGRLRAEASRSVKETLGRIRLVNAGHLRRLVEELMRDAHRRPRRRMSCARRRWRRSWRRVRRRRRRRELCGLARRPSRRPLCPPSKLLQPPRRPPRAPR